MMAKLYYRRIISGAITLEDVPERWKNSVEELLETIAEE